MMVMSAKRETNSQYLHVYLEGDGVPWTKRTIIAADPTSDSVLMLDLMAIDTQDSVYIGRPCYNGTARAPGCDNRLWTSGRYSITVVEAMAGALRQLLKKTGHRYVRLFGHSGGGALAMLLAERFEQVTDVVTLAGNLDTAAWVTHHGYTPLYSSLNPSDRVPLPSTVRQWHWVAGRDRVIPAEILLPFIRRQPNALGVVVSNYSHNCCWQSMWPAALEQIVNLGLTQIPGDIFTIPDVNIVGRDVRRWQ
jgi:pimeloyl-ACP methyl ester carboxylesterase